MLASYTKYGSATFVELVAPVVRRVRLEGGTLFPSVSIAQTWLETGGSVPSWNNLGGYKVGSGRLTPYWDGSSVNTATREVYNGVTVNTTANWRAYASAYAFFKDQALLFNAPRYAPVRAAQTPSEQAKALQVSGYATDPRYADKLINIIANFGLTRYDAPLVAEEDLPMTKEEKAAFDALASRVAKLELKGPAPDWFIAEFGSTDLGGLIKDPRFSEEGWRAIAVVLRAMKRGA
ncbi:glycoside hydrolase family 73 protein [Cohnella sp. GCM10027633]|uniref:glycoside hydrolase family 73 protein n=1 Tax=unclassified Cohnella TaxID=2636738 RepID=UPI00362D91DC